jgi:hypothetical protein
VQHIDTAVFWIALPCSLADDYPHSKEPAAVIWRVECALPLGHWHLSTGLQRPHCCASYLWLYSPRGLGSFFSFLFYIQSVGLLGRRISPSQGRYLHTEQHKHRINAHRHVSRVGFEPTIPVIEQAKTVHALDLAGTVIGPMDFMFSEYLME